jgi:hypothetical protein
MAEPTRNLPILIAWLRANVIATIMLTLTLAGGIYGAGRYLANAENTITQNETDIARASAQVATLQANIVSLDGRINALAARVVDLHTLSDQADAALRARLDVIDALSKYAAERSMQPVIPPPYQPLAKEQRR